MKPNLLFICRLAFVLLSAAPGLSAQSETAPVSKVQDNPPAPEQAVVPEKVYTEVSVAPGYTADKPAYCYFKKLTIKRLSDRRLEITAEMQAEIPSRDERRFWLLFYTDIDKDGKTGTSDPSRKNYGRDIRFGIKRQANSSDFDGFTDTLKVGNKTETIEIKKISVKGATVNFIAQSPLFDKYPSFRFFATTALVTFDDRDKNDIESTAFISFVPRTGSTEF